MGCDTAILLPFLSVSKNVVRLSSRREAKVISCLPLKMKALHCFEVSRNSNSAKQCRIQEDADLFGIPLLRECERLSLNTGNMYRMFFNGLQNKVEQG